ncbi:uncharacterized protein MELLADRAFT_102831 [Melampsora larici-populina 98AG31]|uniref:Uncharacterized protein n=1 Tax=Melampsora larici-populina (strain 98AG31 / pathotype 3-4-7) TaxID=747676 RepID=F4R9I9_MELLP|nr:uncharacterized protein MELLADRAFT_102831 [Melampsora larici-populina 98AG31]EGG11142.1 hypothetical protein MELLADRAFT_102831 [Melampsora larici-populina 98AG31]
MTQRQRGSSLQESRCNSWEMSQTWPGGVNDSHWFTRSGSDCVASVEVRISCLNSSQTIRAGDEARETLTVVGAQMHIRGSERVRQVGGLSVETLSIFGKFCYEKHMFAAITNTRGSETGTDRQKGNLKGELKCFEVVDIILVPRCNGKVFVGDGRKIMSTRKTLYHVQHDWVMALKLESSLSTRKAETEMQSVTRSSGVGSYERLPLRWSGDLNVVGVQRYDGPRRMEYDTLIDLGRTRGSVEPIVLVEDASGESVLLEGRCKLRGVVVQGGEDLCARMVLDGMSSECQAILPGLEGLTVSGRGLVLQGNPVCTDAYGDEWRVAVLMHREWDMAVRDELYLTSPMPLLI